MRTVAGVSALLLLTIGVVSREVRGERAPHAVMLLIGAIPIANSAIHIAVSGELIQSTNIAILIVGGGLLFESRPFFAAFLVLCLGAWLGVGWQTGLTAEPEWLHWAFATFACATLAVFAFRIRRSMLDRALELQASVAEAKELQRVEQEKSKVQAQELHAEKLKSLGLMAGGIAHDLNNILVVVFGSMSLAGEMLRANDPARAELERAWSATERATELTEQMISYVGGGSGFGVEVVDLGQEIRAREGLLRAVAPQAVELEMALAPDPVWVKGRPAQLFQAALNLVINSVEALGKEPGHVVVTTCVRKLEKSWLEGAQIGSRSPAGDYGVLAVSDNGPGIAPEALSQILDPFYSTKELGRGLGLSVLSGVVAAGGGAIRIDSKVGEGATFTVCLPLAEAPAEPAREEVMQQDEQSPRRGVQPTVVVADDDHSVRQIAKIALERAGMNVELAVDGQEAVRLVHTHRPDLLVIDVDMPGINGPEAIEKLTEYSGPIILISGYGADAVTAETRRRVDRFLAKPFRPRELANAAREAINAASASADQTAASQDDAPSD